jgi:hypothetical protein
MELIQGLVRLSAERVAKARSLDGPDAEGRTELAGLAHHVAEKLE